MNLKVIQITTMPILNLGNIIWVIIEKHLQARGNEINGLSRTAYEVADKYQIDCKIDREVIKTGWFSKRYEYHITYSGDNDKVMKAIDDA